MIDVELLTTAEVARKFHVDPDTVARWARRGRIRHIVTPGGQYRFHSADVQALQLNDPDGAGDDG